MIKSKVPLKYIRGKYCNDDTFYTQMEFQGYDIKKLKQDLKEKPMINPILVVDLTDIYKTWNSTQTPYKYAVQDGSHRVRVLKDIAKEKNTFHSELIDVHIIKDYKKYKEENEDEKLL